MSEKKKLPIKPNRAENAEVILGGTQLGTALGSYGAYVGQKALGKLLLKGHESIPYDLKKVDIKDIKQHFSSHTPKKKGVLDFTHILDNLRGEEVSKKLNSKEKKSLLNEIGDLGESFSKKHKLRESGIKFNINAKGKLSDYYNPIKNTVNMSTMSPAVALHEMGHAADYRGNLLKTIGRHLPAALAATGVPLALAYGDEIKEKIPGSVDDKVISFIQKKPCFNRCCRLHIIYFISRGQGIISCLETYER